MTIKKTKKRILKKKVVKSKAKKTSSRSTKKVTKKVVKKSLKKITKKRAVIKKKIVTKKKVTSKKTINRKEERAKGLERVVNAAKEEKELYGAIPAKYRKRIRNAIDGCKKKGFITSSILLDHINLDECDDSKDTWHCIGKILQNNCIDIVEEKGLLWEIELKSDPRFPELNPSSYDSIQMYLRDIGKYPLLTAKQEQEIGKKIVERRDILSKKNKRKLSPTEKKRILDEGLRARNKLAVSNLRLVVSIAKNYAGRSRDLSLLDLVQEGGEGLYRAVDKFEPNRGFKFSTYATWWIKQSIVRGLADKSRTIRIPVHMSETTQKYQKIMVRLEQDLGRTPTVQEIATELGVEPEKIYMIRRISQEVVQLDRTPSGDDEKNNTRISDTVEDHDQDTQELIVSREILNGQVHDVLKSLSQRERQVIELRHGMQDGIQYTLEQIGSQMGVTRERIRQIEARALEKLRSHQVLKKLESY